MQLGEIGRIACQVAVQFSIPEILIDGRATLPLVDQIVGDSFGLVDGDNDGYSNYSALKNMLPVVGKETPIRRELLRQRNEPTFVRADGR